MIGLLLASSIGGDPEPKIVAASLFKNGYAMVIRELEATGDKTTMVKIPVHSLGTLWFGTTDGLRLKSVLKTSREVSSASTASNLADFLRLNKGKRVSIEILSYQVPTTVTGTVLDVMGEVLYLQSDNRRIAGYQISRLGAVTVESADGQTSSSEKRSEAILSFATEGKGKILIMGLEHGMTWSPGYAVELLDDKRLRFFAKSTVLNDLGDLENVNLKFVTGFPNVPWASVKEPLTSGDSLASFLSMIGSIGMPTTGFAGRRDAGVMNQMANMPMPAEMDITGAPAETAEDLFFYSQPGVSMKTGDRAFFLLFQATAEYSHLYTLDIPNTINEVEQYDPSSRPAVPYDVWNTIRFKNTSGQPLTTAPASVFKNNEIMGQDTVAYTSKDAEVKVRMSKALDVSNDSSEEETARERGALKTTSYGVFDLVTISGTIAIQNRKGEAVPIRVTKSLVGEVSTASHSAKLTKTAKGLREVNPRTLIEWNTTIAPGASLKLSYTYKIYVRS